MRNEDSMEQEARRGVRLNKIALAALALLAVIGAWVLLSWFSRPLDDSITPDGLAEHLADGALGKTGGVYYVLDDGSDLVDNLELSGWTVTQEEAEGEPLVVFRLWEDCELALYEDGLAYAWNGYAPSDTTGAVWYTIPEDTARTVASLLRTDGQVEANPGIRF
ncbi:hypothetical protein [uncultured Pseudoflavonifractor sp.]|uniref:hypothetical protein n=1 Tax=uncultured Pseudoflavonifractor sp. TaxID=1221379 RepID=UPI0025FF535D|nr:hypothetical protein [uncultured Pseudoflavonifractor sp.]